MFGFKKKDKKPEVNPRRASTSVLKPTVGEAKGYNLSPLMRPFSLASLPSDLSISHARHCFKRCDRVRKPIERTFSNAQRLQYHP